MARYTSTGSSARLPIAGLAALLTLVLFLISAVFAPIAQAQAVLPRNTLTFIDPNGGPSFTFSSMDTRSDCTSRGDIITTTGLRAGWTLDGYVRVRRPDNAQEFSFITVNQSSDLNLLVPYPPLTQWQDNGSNVEVHVDIAIQVLDQDGDLVNWIGGDLDNAPGVLGPGGQDWDIFCETPPTPAIDIIKFTNGADANNPDAAGVPLIAPGGTVTWAYLINNTGPIDIPLGEITVTDNIPGVTPLFAAVVSGDGKGDGNAILQPGEVWRYVATGLALDLRTPPVGTGLVLVPNVCRAGNLATPGRTAYTNIGRVQIPNMSATDPSSYCNPEASITVLKTADPSYVFTPTWQITKSVTPAVVNLFEGQSSAVTYTVQVTPTAEFGGYQVFGSIYITNTGPIATQISTVVDTVSGAGNAPVSCPGGLPRTLAPGARLLCTYVTPLPDATPRTNTVNVTFEGAKVATATAPVVFGAPTPVIDPVTIDDIYNGGAPTPLASQVVTSTSLVYTRTVVCGSGLNYVNGVATYARANTARIVETEQSADATMTVNCYRPSVEKTVDPDFTRRFTWQIQKRASVVQLDLVDGESAPVTYTVTLTKSAPIDENFRIFGTIRVVNPHPGAALQLTGIADRLGNGLGATVTCPATSVPAGGSLVCTYATAVPNNASGTNTATITATTGIVYSSPVVPYTFVGLPPSQTTLSSVTVTDTNPATGQPWIFAGSGTQSYQVPFACTDIVYDETNLFQRIVDNTVEITQTGQQSSARVTLNCRLPDINLVAVCQLGVAVWTVTADQSGAYVIEFVENGPGGGVVVSTLDLNLVAGAPTTFSYDGDVDNLQEVRMLFNGQIVAYLLGGPVEQLPCSPTSAPPSKEPNGGTSSSIFLPAILRP